MPQEHFVMTLQAQEVDGNHSIRTTHGLLETDGSQTAAQIFDLSFDYAMEGVRQMGRHILADHVTVIFYHHEPNDRSSGFPTGSQCETDEFVSHLPNQAATLPRADLS